MRRSRLHKSLPLHKATPYIAFAIVAISVGLIGFSMLRSGSAATHVASKEAETGTLAGRASIASNSAASGGSSVLFNAPVTDFTGQALPWSASSPWNTRTSGSTNWYDTQSLHIGGTIDLNGTPSNTTWYWVQRFVTVSYGKPTDPQWTLILPAKNGWAACSQGRGPAAAKTVTIRAAANISLPANTGGDDRPMVFVDGTHYYELWQTVINPANRTITTSANSIGSDAWAEGDIVSGSGFSGGGKRAGIRAADFSVAGGLITGYDIAQGKINHALALLLPDNMLNGVGAPPPFLPPATCADNGGATGPIKSGSKIGIPPNTAKPAGLSPMGSMIFDAFQQYGGYVGDYVGGGHPSIAAEYLTTTETSFATFDNPWRSGANGVADYQKIVPLLRVADYQP